MRLFIALDFNELKEDLNKIQDSIDKSLAKLKEVSTFHLTLKFLGEVSEDKFDLIREKLKEIKRENFSLSLDKIGVFPTDSYIKVIWVGVSPSEGVIELQNKIELSLKEFNFKKDYKFHPHITLARVSFVKDKANFIKNLKEIRLEQKSLEVKDFRLVKSTLTPKGPVYEDLETFQLTL
jgi:2'-5' RNA ligase